MVVKVHPLLDQKEGSLHLYLGNEAIVRGALEGGVSVAAAYPGTPSSEILEGFSRIGKSRHMYVEWSVNEKVSCEVAAAASFSGLRSLCAMKQNGINVASDFLLHLALSGIRAGMVLVACEDPGALSSQNEAESRYFARLLEVPVLEPGNFQELKDMTAWAFDLSEQLHQFVIVRSCTRLSHASGIVKLGKLPEPADMAHFHFDGGLLDPLTGPMHSNPASLRHNWQQEKLKKARSIFEDSAFNSYQGSENPELLIITGSAANLYSKEAVHMLGLKDRVGIVKIGTTWPLPQDLVKKHLAKASHILFVEEVLPFMEEQVKMLAGENAAEVGIKTFYGKNDGTLPMTGELNPDIVMTSLAKIFNIKVDTAPQEWSYYAAVDAQKLVPGRELTFCAGCPHRASYWSIHNALQMVGREGFVNGDVGCYGLAIISAGFYVMKSHFSMGSGTGLASGFGKLREFGMEQPVLSVCGDSTFFHAAMPALVNAVHNKSNIIMVILDNGGTAMTGFQPHPGLKIDAMGNSSMPAINIEAVCSAIGAKTRVCDPFDLSATKDALLEFLEDTEGTKVLILKQMCALSPEKRSIKQYRMSVDKSLCLADTCGCNRLCTRVFRCPGLRWDPAAKATSIDEVVCNGCGVCADICPTGAIQKVKNPEAAKGHAKATVS